MDKTLNSSLMSNRSPFLKRTQHNASLKRSVVTPRKSSRFSVSGKSTQSMQIIIKTQNNAIERFGQPLPVLVTEALTFADRNSIVSTKIADCGYAWLVCGRRLLIWQYRQGPILPGTPQRRNNVSNQCYELQLPQSDLAHRAELVSVFVPAGTHVPSCIAVTPEGLVRYWPAACHESLSVEHTVALQGQECDSLTAVAGMGCAVLATTTCTIVLVQPETAAGGGGGSGGGGGRHAAVHCRQLRGPSGWLGLGGLSRRMSSFIFGPMAAGEQTPDTRPVRVLCAQQQSISHVYVLANHSLQKWKLSNQEADTLVYILDLTRLIREGFANTVWENSPNDPNDQDTWLLDLQSDNSDNIVILAAAVNLQLSPQIHYALVSVDSNSAQTNITSFREFRVLKMTGLYQEESAGDVLQYRFLLCGGVAYVYNKRCVTVIKSHDDEDCLEFATVQDYLLSGSICVNTPIFFSRNNGLVSVSGGGAGTSGDFTVTDLNISAYGSNTPLERSLNESMLGSLSMYQMDAEEVMGTTGEGRSVQAEGATGHLKAAFLYHIKGQYTSVEDIIRSHFPPEGTLEHASIDSLLDRTVIQVCRHLLDDIPSKDPRWAGQSGIGSSYSMQVLHQLEDKQKAFALFLNFLKQSDLWERLSAVILRDTTMATIRVIAELEEKLIAAISLKSLPNNELLDKIIESTVDVCDEDLSNGLSHKDIFYREVTNIISIFQELVDYCDKKSHSDLSPSELAVLIQESNEIIISVLNEVLQHRQKQSEFYNISNSVRQVAPDYIPWTTAAGSDGIYDSLISQQSITFNYGIKQLGDCHQCSLLYDQMVTLIDMILDGRKAHVESIKGTDRNTEDILMKQYQKDRQFLIKPLIDSKEWDRALQLAEKYLDFESLAVICDVTQRTERLDEYMQRYSDDGFAEYLYRWYVRENKRGALIDRCRQFRSKTSTVNTAQDKLCQFLGSQPELAWIQQAFDGSHGDAAATLRRLGDAETESLTRQKTIYSLAKLAKLSAGGGEVFLTEVNRKLEVIGYQEELPDYVLLQYGYDTLRPRVISARDLVHLHICSEYREAGELEFKRALDLVEYVPLDEAAMDQTGDDDVHSQLRLAVWRAAILRDTWDERRGQLDEPLALLQHKLFFRIVELALALGNYVDLHELLPTLDTLLEDADLRELQDNKTFQFLLKTGYEHIFSVHSI